MIHSSSHRSEAVVRLTLATALVCASASSPLLAEESPVVQEKAIERYAGKYGVSLEESRARLLLQDRAEGIGDRLVALLGDQFAGLWYDHSDRVGKYESSTSCYTMYQGIRGAENAMNVDILTAP